MRRPEWREFTEAGTIDGKDAGLKLVTAAHTQAAEYDGGRMVLPAVPGIIEAAMTVTAEPDGRLSFRVLVGTDSDRSSGCDLVELIISPEHVCRALGGMKIREMADADQADERSAFPCHIGFYRDAGCSAA